MREASVSVAELTRAGRVTELQGIGKTLQEKIIALLETGSIPAAERLKARFPQGLIEITRLPGIGAKRARKLHDELGIDSPKALRDAALAQQLRGVRGFGPKFEQSVIETLNKDLKGGANVLGSPRVLLPAALQTAEALAAGLRERGPAAAQILVAGSIRRQAEAVKDIDLIAVTEHPLQLAQTLSQLEQIETVSSASATGARGRTHSGLPVDLRIASPEQLGNLLQHFTGSGRHNAALREAAVKLHLHVSEHRIEDEETGNSLTCLTEGEVYQALHRAWIPPELREDRGEIAASLLYQGTGRQGKRGGDHGDQGTDRQVGARGEDHRLPQLIEEAHIRGDLHCHTIASDGHASIEEMALAALQRGYSYLAITDHSASHGFGNAVSPAQLCRQIERVRECDAQLQGIKLLCGSEVNILPDGSLDYEDELLSQLDWVIASVHTAFQIGADAMTKRIVTAMQHPLVDAIGHPTGRKILRREPYPLHIDQLIAAAAETKTMLEINANPDRRDLSELHARAAAQAGVMLVIDSDAHRPSTLANMRWGIATARRAWLTKADVANTRTWGQLQRLRKRRA